jgi:hypothetical protein
MKDMLGQSTLSINHLKRRSSKIELNKILPNPRINRKILIKRDALLDDKLKSSAIQKNPLKKQNLSQSQKFILVSKPDNPKTNKVFMLSDFEVKESLFSHLEKTRKLGNYLKKFRKPSVEPSNLWTEKVSSIQKNFNTTVFNTGIISRMVLHEYHL